MREDGQEILDLFDLKLWAEREGLSFKETRGRSGPQLNFKDCPNPDCQDHRYRVYVNEETGVGNCFKCNETFNKAKFVRMTIGGNWRDTFTHIRTAVSDQGWRPKTRIEVAVEEKATLPLSFPLPTADGQNLLYLEQRGITAEWAKYFHLRFCEDGWWNFKKLDGSIGGQNFGGRVIIPVYDLNGEFMTFQGRDLTGESDRKYLFPSGLPGTGRFLLNGQNAMHKREIAMGEGFFDVAAMKIAFDEDPTTRHVEPVGSFGKHLSYGDTEGNDQVGRLITLQRHGLKQVTICWDGEENALVAALNAAQQIRRIGLAVKIALLPAGCDPNEITAQKMRECFWQATPYTPSLDVKWRLRNPYRRR